MRMQEKESGPVSQQPGRDVAVTDLKEALAAGGIRGLLFRELKKKLAPKWNARSLLAAYIPVLLGYGLAVQGLEPLELETSIHPGLGLLIAALFTATHAVVPVFFYFFGKTSLGFFKSIAEAQPADADRPGAMPVMGKVMTGFLFLHMGFWYCIPLAAYAAVLGGWWGAAFAGGGVIHFILAGRGKRAWTLMEYGSTSVALLLYAGAIDLPGTSPLWLIAAALVQAGLLTLVEVFGRALWIEEAAGA